MPSDPPALGADTAAGCWVCDRDRGELCHVHESRTEDDAEPGAVVVSLPEASEAAP